MSIEINNKGFVYKWTNIKNNKWYVGSHCGDINDGYTASGTAIKRAFKKYGLDVFSREILYTGENYKEKEEEILLEMNAANDPLSYNLKNTAIGGDVWVGRKDTEEYKEYIKKLSQPGEKNGMFGKNHSDEIKELISKINRGKKSWNAGIKGYMSEEHAMAFSRKGFKHSEETKKKMSEGRNGSKNGNAKKITIDGITYNSLLDASFATGLSYYKISKLNK